MSSRLLKDASILRLIQIALQEDIGSGDITSECTIPQHNTASAKFVAKESAVVCGLPIVDLVFRQFEQEINFDTLVEEGATLESGTTIGTVEGPAHVLLAAERTALNFMQRMSGVATKTRQYMLAIAGTKARILDTRKTVPGWRTLDKYATSVGGAVNHRMGLYDMVMVKDNHITAAGGVSKAVKLCVEERAHKPNLFIEVEARNMNEVHEIMQIKGVDRIMFDNFTPEQCANAVRIVDGVCETEASGGITLSNIREYAEAGVDFISVGAITHSATAVDISMKLFVPRQG